jgi:hypothetical protein
MEMRNVITTVEVIVDINFPVAIDIVGAAVKVMELGDAEGGDALDEASEKF